MKTQIIIPAAAACLLASCATDPAIFEKKNSVSVGRFGVTQPTQSVQNEHTAEVQAPAETPQPIAEAQAPAPAPTPAPEPPAPVAQQQAASEPVTVSEKPKKKRSGSIGRFGYVPSQNDSSEEPAAAPQQQEPSEKKSGGFFSFFKKKEKPAEETPAAAVVAQEKPAQKKVTQKQDNFASAPAPRQKKGGLSDDIRLPNLLGMPEDKELKATSPQNKSTDDGPVISRPPVEKKN